MDELAARLEDFAQSADGSGPATVTPDHLLAVTEVDLAAAVLNCKRCPVS